MQECTNAYFTAKDGTKLWYRTRGQGPVTLVLCDGVGCTGYIWKYLIPYFIKTHRILHTQYRGHGRSGIPNDLKTMSVEQFAEDLAEVVGAVAADGPVVLIGHSMGVQVALEYYGRRPGNIQALILVNGPYEHALRHVHSTELFAQALPTVRSLLKRWQPAVNKYWRPLMDSELSYVLALAFEVNPRLTKHKDFRPYFKDLGKLDPEVFFTAISFAEKHSAAHILPKIKVPVLVVASDRDRFTPFPVMKRMFHKISGAEMLELPSASHIGPLELPELLHLRMEKFLRLKYK